MSLTKFGFIVTGSGLDPSCDRAVMKSGQFEMIAVGVASPCDGPAAAQALVEEGIQLLELCGGFGPIWTAKVIKAIRGCVPVGAVGYGPEAITPLQALFGTNAG